MDLKATHEEVQYEPRCPSMMGVKGMCEEGQAPHPTTPLPQTGARWGDLAHALQEGQVLVLSFRFPGADRDVKKHVSVNAEFTEVSPPCGFY